jgi:hypothetical protein
MRTVFVVIGFFVVLILLVSNGIVGAGVCVRGVGCVASTGNGAVLDDSQRVVISTQR